MRYRVKGIPCEREIKIEIEIDRKRKRKRKRERERERDREREIILPYIPWHYNQNLSYSLVPKL